MARKEGFGKVVVNGKRMTQKMYKQAVIDTFTELNNPWLSTDTVISYASNKGWVEKKTRSRKAHSHPLYRIMTYMCESDLTLNWRFNSRGILEYKLK